MAYQGLEYVGQFGKATFWLLANFLGIGLAPGVIEIARNCVDAPQRLVFLGLVEGKGNFSGGQRFIPAEYGLNQPLMPFFDFGRYQDQLLSPLTLVV